MRRFRAGWCGRRERGQAMLYFGIIAPVLFLALGLVVETGYLITQYRQMQSAADVAALVGAQALPCEMTQTSCISAAELRACNYAQQNGFSDSGSGAGNCHLLTGYAASGSDTAVSAYVPPQACSPYDLVNYGNSATNPHCKTSNAPLSEYAYVEVRVAKSLTVPFFGKATTLVAHAVARHGQISPKRFAIIVLDPTMSKALSFSGSQGGGMVAVGPVVSDSTASDSIYTGGSSTQIACSGQWYTAANEVVPPGGPAAGLTSNTTGTSWFAPPACTGGALDSPPQMITNTPPVPDPYSSSVQPVPQDLTLPQGSTLTPNLSNCSPCNHLAYYYTWSTGSRSTGSWKTVNNLPNNIGNGSNIELYPGIYPKTISINGGNVYINPGVYTLEAGFNQTGGNVCIYGAPTCDAQINTVNSADNCSTTSFRSTDSNYAPSGNWYYYCSPWGMWDSNSYTGRPAGLPTTAPTFTDGTTPLNGVTFFLQGGSFNINGNGASYLAFPDPCPGTGTSGANSVDFPAGAPTTTYAYPSGSLALLDGVAHSTSWVYPNADMGFGAECSQSQPPNPVLVWTGEMVGQHLHFLVFARSTTSTISLNGGGLQNWWGIVYNPGATGCGTACTISLNGNGGAGSGAPLMSGQIIADNASFSGNAAFEVFYSPCRPDGDVCSIGFGTSLVE